jgi:UDP-N-acetyl-D-mannosaminouronate:lipid I N-acetyl-D-mannosaminouronosyltransferase
MERYRIRNLYVYGFRSRDELIDFAVQEKKILVAINAEKILKNEEKLVQLINNNIGYPDGIGAVKALKQKGFKKAIKIPGVELWLDIIRKKYKEKTFYIIGSTQDVIENCYRKLHSDFPGIRILGYHSGYFNEQEKLKLKEDLIKLKPEIVFVAMGSPKQEYFMEELLYSHPALYMGLGGSYDVYTGKVKRAPKFFVSLGLEWLYRLLKQPTRIKRQIVLIKFFLLLLFRKL